MKVKTFIFLFLFRSLSLRLYIKLRSIIQLKYVFPKKNTLSSFLLGILQNKNTNEKKLRRIFADRILVIDYVKQNTKDIFFPKIIWATFIRNLYPIINFWYSNDLVYF